MYLLKLCSVYQSAERELMEWNITKLPCAPLEPNNRISTVIRKIALNRAIIDCNSENTTHTQNNKKGRRTCINYHSVILQYTNHKSFNVACRAFSVRASSMWVCDCVSASMSQSVCQTVLCAQCTPLNASKLSESSSSPPPSPPPSPSPSPSY